MSALVFISLCIGQGPMAANPEAALVLAIAKHAVAVKTVAVVSDNAEEEARSATLALRQSGLFEPKETKDAAAVLKLSRREQVILASLSTRDGNELWRGEIHWPLPQPDGERDEEQLHQHQLTYKRERVRVRRAQASVASPTVIVSGGGHFRSPWGASTMVGYSPRPASGWMILQGEAQVLDDHDLAKLLNNEALMQKIDRARARPKLYWAIGFGSASAAALGAGAYMLWGKDRISKDRRTAGTSLMTLGVASGVIALLYNWVGKSHVLSPGEAEKLADQHNEALRKRLKLRPSDLPPDNQN